MHAITRRSALGTAGALPLLASVGAPAIAAGRARMQSWPIKATKRTGIHDVAPAPDGSIWFAAQESGQRWFDPKSGRFEFVTLRARSSPHGVVQGPDKAARITDGAQIRRPTSSSRIRSRSRTAACASCMAAPAKCGSAKAAPGTSA